MSMVEVKRVLSFVRPFLVLLFYAGTISAQDSYPEASLRLMEALRSSLMRHPALQEQQAEIDIAIGTREQVSGQFDWLLQSGLTHTRQNALAQSSVPLDTTNATTYGVSANRLLRNGILVSPSFQFQKTTDNLDFPNGANMSSGGLQVMLPLLRGRGRQAVAAQEDADNLQVRAARYDLNFLISQIMGNVAISYWNLVAACKRLIIAQDAEARGKAFVENTQLLINADHVPHNDIYEAKANLAQRSSFRITTELELATAQQQLKLDMGLRAEQMADSLPEPADEFPASVDVSLPSDSTQSLRYYIDEALRRRGDYLASVARARASHVVLDSTHNALLPQLNLTMGAGYSAFSQSPQPPAALSHAGGPGATAGINYVFPFRDTAAHGAYLQAQATLKQSTLQTQELARNISQSVLVALQGLRSAGKRVGDASRSVEFFQASLTGAREKYHVGLGSVVEILTIEDKLTAALEDETDAQCSYAIALIQFRVATGTLVAADQTAQHIPLENFLTVPFGNSGELRPVRGVLP